MRVWANKWAVAWFAIAAVLAVCAGPASASSPEWDALVAAAKKEGKVEVILSGQMPVKLRPVMSEFEKTYGITVNFQTGQGRAHAARILAERQMGRHTIDIWIGGANTALAMLLPNKALASLADMLIDPDVKDPKKWYNGKLHFTDPDGKYILAWGASPAYVVCVNTNLVKIDEIKSYWDLLDPKWKGKIVGRSFAETGSGATTVPMLLNPKIGEKWFEKLVTEMDYTLVRDSRQGAEWVALGRYAIGLFGLNTPAVELEKQGFPIKSFLPQVLSEGEMLTSSAANIMAIDSGPHPNAQKLFVNWFLSKDVQTRMVKAAETSDSLRVDVAEDTVPDQYRIKRGRNYYVAFSDPVYINEQENHLKILRGLVKKLKK